MRLTGILSDGRREEPEFVVSACLAGLCCRYDGGSNPRKEIVELYKAGRALPICPESLAGLTAPRLPCERRGDRIMAKNGDDMSGAFEKGARAALDLALACGARKAILKARSPSCGIGQIYDGSFSRKLCPGNGVWAQKLIEAGFELYDEDNLPALAGMVREYES